MVDDEGDDEAGRKSVERDWEDGHTKCQVFLYPLDPDFYYVEAQS